MIEKSERFACAMDRARTRRAREKDYGQFEHEPQSVVYGAKRGAAKPQLASLSVISGESEKNTGPTLKIWRGARRVSVSIPDDEPRLRAQARKIGILLGQVDPDAGKRGKITGFSAASRRRLFERLSTVRRDANKPIFYTLTIPRELYSGAKQAKAWHRALWKRIVYRWPLAAGIWKLEPQADGTAHFHALVWGIAFLPWQRLSVAWAEVMSGAKLGEPPSWRGVDAGEAAARFRAWADKVSAGAVNKALNAATRVEAIRSWRGVMSYAAKYVGKQTEGMEDSGRYWGVVGKAHFPDVECEEIQVEFDCAYRAIRLIRRRLRAVRGWEEWIERARTCICEDPEKWEELI